jgi:fructose-1,6-bisphosphatase/inositol monophosphatase family enzyme
VDFYLHGGQNLWDFAAGSLIAAEAGADVATMEGEPLFAGDILRRSVLAVAQKPLRAELAPYLCPEGSPG